MKTTWADSWSDFSQPCDIDLWVMKPRSLWPIFRGPVILPYILKTIWCTTIILWDSAWPVVWPQNKCRSLTYISWSTDFALYFEDYLIYEHHTLGLWVSMTRCSTLKKCRSLWPMFYGPVILPLSWRLFDVWTSYFRIMSQYNPTFDLKINVGHYDLYFMVQWLCLYLEDCLMHEYHTLGL